MREIMEGIQREEGTGKAGGARRRKGLNLLEILIGTAILAMFGSALLGVLSTGHKGSSRIIEDSVAAYIGSGLLEKLILIPYTKLPVIPDGVPDGDLADKFTAKAWVPFIEPYPPGYKRFVTIKEVSKRTRDPKDGDNSRWGNLKVVQVRVEWDPLYLGKKSTRVLVFQSLVTDDTEAW